MLRTFPAWPAPTVEPTSSASVPPPISSGGAPAVQQVAAPPTNSTKGEVWVCTVAVNIRRDPSFRCVAGPFEASMHGFQSARDLNVECSLRHRASAAAGRLAASTRVSPCASRSAVSSPRFNGFGSSSHPLRCVGPTPCTGAEHVAGGAMSSHGARVWCVGTAPRSVGADQERRRDTVPTPC
jgi:hypothetical protein